MFCSIKIDNFIFVRAFDTSIKVKGQANEGGDTWRLKRIVRIRPCETFVPLYIENEWNTTFKLPCSNPSMINSN